MKDKNVKFEKPQNVKVNLKETSTIKCKKCDNYLFIESYILKRLSPLLSPTGKEAIIPIQVFSCGECGNILRQFLEDEALEDADL